MAVPADIAAHFRLVESQVFAGLQVLFHAKASANGLHHGGERRGKGSPDQVIGQLVRVIEATADEQPVSSIDGAALHPGEPRPVEAPFAFGAQTLAEAAPVLRASLLRVAAHTAEQGSAAR